MRIIFIFFTIFSSLSFFSFEKKFLDRHVDKHVEKKFSDGHIPAQKWIDTHFSKKSTEIDASNRDLIGFIDFSAFTRLEKIDLDNNYNVEVKVSENRQLKWFSANDSFYWYFPFLKDNFKLKYLSLRNTPLSYYSSERIMNLKNNYELKHLDLRGVRDPYNKDKLLELQLPYNFNRNFDAFYKSNQIDIKYLFNSLDENKEIVEKDLTPPKNWKLITYESTSLSIWVKHYDNFLMFDDKETHYNRPSEKWANEPFNEAIDHRIYKGLKNWYDFKQDVPYGPNLTKFSRFFVWIYDGYFGQKWIVPVWYELKNFQTPIQEWLDKQDPESKSLKAPAMNFIGHADLERFYQLEYLDLFYNQITSIDVSSNYWLQFLYLNNNCLKEIDLSNNYLLYVLHAEDNLPNLFIRLHWEFNNHWYLFYHDDDAIIDIIKQPEKNAQKWLNKKFDTITKKKEADRLQGSNLNLVDKINFYGFPNLKVLWLFNNNLTEIDVSYCASLVVLWVQNNPNLKKIIVPRKFYYHKERLFEYDNDHDIEIVLVN